MYLNINCDNNTIIGNTLGNSGTNYQNRGVSINENSNNNSIINNTITSTSNNGIRIEDRSNNNRIIGNNITDSSISGIYIYDRCNLTYISGNNISNSVDYGIEVYLTCENTTIYDNIIIDNGDGVYLHAGAYNTTVSFNIISNLYTTNQGFGLILSSNYTQVIANKIFNNVNYGMYITAGNQYITRNWVIGGLWPLYYDTNWENTYILNNFDGVHDPILIDDDGGTAGAYTWVQLEQLAYWITGSGAGDDPYIIEDLIINGNNTSNGIYIIDSEVVFIIRNCYLTNSSLGGGYDAGIHLDDTYNGTIFNNNCSLNNGQGIQLMENSQNITIYNNTLNGNKWGVMLFRCHYNNISENTLYDNTDDGIYLYDSHYNLVFNNTVINAFDNGIQIWHGEHNDILNNTVYDSDIGIYIYNSCYNNTFSGNDLYNNDNNGIYMTDDCDYNNFTWNIAKNEGSSAQNNGIKFYDDCDFNLIQYNTVYDITEKCIVIELNCDNNTISNNHLYNFLTTYADRGVMIDDHSHNNTVSYNTIEKMTVYGIQMYDNSHDNYIYMNTINQTLGSGIMISCQSDSENNQVIENICIDDNSAVMKQWSNNNYFTRNTLYSPVEAEFQEDWAATGNVYTNNFIYDSDGWHMDWLIIDNSAPGAGDYYWYSASLYMWCSGTGGINDPYLLENIEFNCLSASPGIIVRNSYTYFRIENCRFINSIDSSNGAFIYLQDVMYGILVDNDCSDGLNHGIYLKDADYNTIANNTVNNNEEHGIYLKNSENNKIQGNLIYYSGGNGIFIETNYKNTISGNDARYSGESGIKIVKGEDSDILNNQVNYNTWNGIHLDRSFFCNIEGNIASNNDDNGIYLFSSYNNTLDTNTANSNGLYGISLLLSDNNTVNNNTVLYNIDDIYEESCTGNTITNNIETIPEAPPEEPVGDTIINEGDTITDGGAMTIAIVAVVASCAIGGVSVGLLLIMQKKNQELKDIVVSAKKDIASLKGPKGPTQKGPVKKDPVKK